LVWVYCKTVDAPKKVGEYICEANFGQVTDDLKSHVKKYESEDDCWLIETDPSNETSAMIYRIGNEVVVIEIDESCASNVIEPLMSKYGFDNVKWLLTNLS